MVVELGVDVLESIIDQAAAYMRYSGSIFPVQEYMDTLQACAQATLRSPENHQAQGDAKDTR
jgi:hypothetical protein